MVKDSLSMRIRRCGVSEDTLYQGVECGAYRNVKEVLDKIEQTYPVGSDANHLVALNRMVLVNNDIDRALYSVAQATSAWTWLGDYGIVFVLMGPEARGLILHKKMHREVQYKLEFQPRVATRFLRFEGDDVSERTGKISKFQLLAGKMHMSTTEARDIFEALTRVCDDPAWNHTSFPILYPGKRLDTAYKLLKQHNLLVHNPYQPNI